MPHATAPRLILASASAARLALLRGAGLAVDARPAHIDEAEIKAAARADGATPDDAALLLAELKATRIARRQPDALVIAADQLLVVGEEWLDKPPTLDAARAQLLTLRGRTHTLITAVLCQRGDARIWHHVTRPSLTMREFSEEFLNAYLAAEGDALTAWVGSYRLEGMGVQLFERIEGDYFSILGLPLLPLLGFLRQHGAAVA